MANFDDSVGTDVFKVNDFTTSLVACCGVQAGAEKKLLTRERVSGSVSFQITQTR